MPPRGDHGPLCEGLAWFREGERFGYQDADGEVVVAPTYDDVTDFQDGRAVVGRAWRYGVIDRTGREVVPLRFVRLSAFQGGRAAAWLPEGGGALVDRDGAVVAPDGPPYEVIALWWCDDRVCVRRDGRFGFVAPDGREAVPCRYDETHGSFTAGRVGVKRDGRWGFVDVDGREVVPPRYAWVGPYFGLVPTAGVRSAAGYGRVDHDGRECVPCAYPEEVGHFQEGRAKVNLGPIVDRGRDGEGTLVAAQLGFVDHDGVCVIPCRYETATAFEGGRAWVTLPGQPRRFAIDRDGNEV